MHETITTYIQTCWVQSAVLQPKAHLVLCPWKYFFLCVRIYSVGWIWEPNKLMTGFLPFVSHCLLFFVFFLQWQLVLEQRKGTNYSLSSEQNAEVTIKPCLINQIFIQGNGLVCRLGFDTRLLLSFLFKNVPLPKETSLKKWLSFIIESQKCEKC